MRLRLLGALVPVLAVAVILTRGGGGMHGEAKGGKAAPFVIGAVQILHHDPEVEQWMDWTVCCDPALEPEKVHNLTGCGWDVDDARKQIGSGDIDIGQQVSLSTCLVNDASAIWACREVGWQEPAVCAWWSGQSARHGFRAEGDSSALNVTACFQPQDRCFALSPVLTNAKTNHYVYEGCLDADYTPVQFYPQGHPQWGQLVNADVAPDIAYPLPLVVIPGSAGIRAGYGVLTTATLTATNPTGAVVRNAALTVSVDGLGRETVCPFNPPAETDEGYPFKSWP
jgi:hypothetical protein